MDSEDVDEYFLRGTKKPVVSKNSINRISAKEFVDEDELLSVLKEDYVKHDTLSLLEKYQNNFDKWLFYLKEGFNLLMYGYGSKINLINSFHSKMLSDYHVVVVKGFQDISVKEIFGYFINDIFEQPKHIRNTSDALEMIKTLLYEHNAPVFLIVHSIDGSSLRKTKCQEVLSKLASFKNLYLIASVDHINASAMWGDTKLKLFNFLWIEVPTFEPYYMELYSNNLLNSNNSLQLLDQNYSDLIFSSLTKLFDALTRNVKKIFQIIAKHHLDNKNNKSYKGIFFGDLLSTCKDLMLVTTATTLRNQLKMFFDQKFLKEQNSYLQICCDTSILLKFYEENFDDDD